jgi:hypothetical protein
MIVSSRERCKQKMLFEGFFQDTRFDIKFRNLFRWEKIPLRRRWATGKQY